MNNETLIAPIGSSDFDLERSLKATQPWVVLEDWLAQCCSSFCHFSMDYSRPQEANLLLEHPKQKYAARSPVSYVIRNAAENHFVCAYANNFPIASYCMSE